MCNVEQNLHQIKQRITNTALSCERSPESITLVAVSKTKPVILIEQAIKAGQFQFGENYVQEGVDKVKYFIDRASQQSLTWHFIGPLQSNKTRPVAETFDWVHTIDRLKIAERLSAQRPANKSPLNVLIQINISGEQSKSGIEPDALMSLAEQIVQLPNLTLRGLMAIPAATHDSEKQRCVFKRMSELFSVLQQKYPHIDTLSMGMSDDMQSAIEAGSTLVRIGSAIFGARDYSK